MTMRITMLSTVMGESGSLLTATTTYTVSDAFGAAMVGSGRATDTDSALKPTSAENIAYASRNLVKADIETMIKCNSASAVVISVTTDAVGGFRDRDTVALYQAGAGAASFAPIDGSVTIRGTMPTIAQFGMMGIVRVGANEWAYIQ